MAVILIAGAIPDLPPPVLSVLLSNGHEVHIINHHSKLWATIAALRPALVVIDENMKTHDGRKFCRDIKQNKNTQHISVILLTADKDLAGRADATIQRPFEAELFTEIIQRVLKMR